MITYTIHRFIATAYGTIGVLEHKQRFLCFTLEPPLEKTPEHRKVAIPQGIYPLTLDTEGELPTLYRRRHGKAAHPGMLCISQVPKRTEINFHCGNNPGHTLGCPLVGLSYQVAKDDNISIIHSRKAYLACLKSFMNSALRGNEQICIVNLSPVQYAK